MKLGMIISSLLVSFIFNQTWAQNKLVEVTVKLSPVGSYVAKTSEVQGTIKVMGGKVTASEVKVQAKTLKTGITLRDKHTLERLQADKFPEIVLLTGEGVSGKGKGRIKIKGIEKPIEGTYKTDGKKIIAEFKLSIKQFGIENVKYLGVGVKDEVEIKVQMPVTP